MSEPTTRLGLQKRAGMLLGDPNILSYSVWRGWAVAVFSLHTNHTRTQQPRTHKLAEVSCRNVESGGKVNVFKVEVQTLL